MSASEAVIAAARNTDGRSTVLIFDGFRMGGHRAVARLSAVQTPDREVVCAWDGRSLVKVVDGLYDNALIEIEDQEIRLKVAPWDFILDAQEAEPEPEPEPEIPKTLPKWVQGSFLEFGGLRQTRR